MKKQIKKVSSKGVLMKTYLLGIISSIFLVPIFVYAQIKYEQSLFGLFEYAKDIINDLLLWLFTTGAVVIFLGVIALQIWKISQGDGTKNFKSYLLYGLIALTVMFTFYAVSSLIAVTFGIQIGIPQFFQDQNLLSPGSGNVPNSRSFIDN